MSYDGHEPPERRFNPIVVLLPIAVLIGTGVWLVEIAFDMGPAYRDNAGLMRWFPVAIVALIWLAAAALTVLLLILTFRRSDVA